MPSKQLMAEKITYILASHFHVTLIFQNFYIFAAKAVLVSYMCVLKMWTCHGQVTVILLEDNLSLYYGVNFLIHCYPIISRHNPSYHESLSFLLNIYLTVEMLIFKVKTEK